MRMPYSQLRCEPADSCVWGINISRWINRKSEEDDYAPVNPAEHGVVSHFAELIGIRNIKPPARFSAIPYLMSRAHLYEPVPDDPFTPGHNFNLRCGGEL